MPLLPANPARSAIKPRVIVLLNDHAVHNHAPANALADLNDDTKNEGLSLSRLNLDDDDKKNLSFGYSAISKSYKGGIGVGIGAAGACDTVGDAINLTHMRATGRTK